MASSLLALEIGAEAGVLELDEGLIVDTGPFAEGSPTRPDRHTRLITRLARAGHLPDPRWRHAFETASREDALPRVYAPRTGDDATPPTWRLLDRAVAADRLEWHARIHAATNSSSHSRTPLGAPSSPGTRP